MLSQQTIDVIKSTVPVLEVHGTAITKRFYEMMFAKHPELLDIFNHVNQKQGRQQTALANAVYAAALHIDNLEAILPVVKQIGHKHRSLGILPEHYPIVGENLLAAIKDVLGDAATDEIIQAWADAYGVIADAFISVEAQMYEQACEQPGGWADFREFVVQRKVAESDVIHSFYLVPKDGRQIAAYEPGQYVSVKVDIPGEKNTHIRQYSLSDAPGNSYYRISVKREDALGDKPAGKVSVYLAEKIGKGDVLLLSAPAGDFTLDQEDKRPLVLISGGVGLTPMISMLTESLKKNPERSVTFIHAAQNGNLHAMKDAVEGLAMRHPQLTYYWCYEKPTDQDRENKAFHKEGYVELPWLQSVITQKESSYYFCGPVPFMKAMNRALKEWEVPAADIHYEFFGPAGSLE
ncbi:flavohemoprotein [Brevibacillus reuszeri]|uniref:Flavohemoprotein n=1 Tax=Brevibacillus reuszeri TaxID=54915 RepID=A0A0K9YY64_9BACL|nr:NO-inducible flavohemoprotein [Brevibacillus reuszeri]KNB73180.1 dihydropteridine reductase [Brevibacillus reuszeri]MED1856779.1 NO-inducible flavohemoprotein [Brevibacillus reuszeri]GED68472.1 flavohemoprotein [Brevibacillus reuszeri]